MDSGFPVIIERDGFHLINTSSDLPIGVPFTIVATADDLREFIIKNYPNLITDMLNGVVVNPAIPKPAKYYPPQEPG